MKTRSEQLLQKILLYFISFHLINFANSMTTSQPQTETENPVNTLYGECFLDELGEIKGVCTRLSDCPKAVERWEKDKIPPQTCFFKKFEHIVCCEIENKTTSGITQLMLKRRSELECEFYYDSISNKKKEAINKRKRSTAPQEFPFMAALGWRYGSKDQTVYRCGGALISKKFVLTAAHCIELEREPPHVVRLGGVDLVGPNVEDIRIINAIVHPKFNISSSYNDIAILELEREALMKPICIWSENEVQNKNVTAIGYGYIRFDGVLSDKLLNCSLFLVSNTICQSYYAPDGDLLQNGVASTHICAGDPEKYRDTCKGDSGGPIVMKVERFGTVATYIVGITSFGQECAAGPPSIYTRTSSYIDWIEDIVWPSN